MLSVVGVQLFQLVQPSPSTNLQSFTLLSTSNNTLLPDVESGILPPFSKSSTAEVWSYVENDNMSMFQYLVFLFPGINADGEFTG